MEMDKAPNNMKRMVTHFRVWQNVVANCHLVMNTAQSLCLALSDTNCCMIALDYYL